MRDSDKSLANELILQELREVKKGMNLVYQAIERLAANEKSVSRAQEDIRRLFDMQADAVRDNAALIDKLRTAQEGKMERLAERQSKVEKAVARMGGDLRSRGKIDQWLANNGMKLLTAIATTAVSVWAYAVFVQ